MVKILMDYDYDFPELQSHTFARMSAYLELHLIPNVVSHDDATKAHGLSTQINDKPGENILLSMNAAQVTAYLALQDEVKKLRKQRNKNNKSKCQNGKSEVNNNSDDETERPHKKNRRNESEQRPDKYCWCHGTQRTHTSPECEVMAADKGRYTAQMRSATKSTSCLPHPHHQTWKQSYTKTTLQPVLKNRHGLKTYERSIMIPTLPMITTIIANPAGKANQNENKDD